MNRPIINYNIQSFARVTGFAYLGIIIFAIFAEGYVRGSLVFPDNSAKTAANIIENQMLWRYAMISDVFTIICDLIVASGLYIILRPINYGLSIMAALIRVSAVTVLAVAGIFHYAPMFLVNADALSASFTALQSQNLAILSIRLHNVAYHISLIIFGVNSIILGLLMFKAKFLPKAIGVLIFACGVTYFLNSLLHFIAPKIQDLVSTPFLLFGLIAELALTFWLIFKGIDVVKWNEACQIGD